MSGGPGEHGGEGQGQGTSLTLLERVRANDGGAWTRLVRLYTPLVRYWCGRLGVRREDADDVLQEVFAATAQSLDNFRRDRPGDTFRGWLRGLTRNVVLAHGRRAGRQPRGSGGTDALARMQEVPGGGADPDPEDPPAEVAGLYRRALDLVRGAFEERTWQMFWSTAVEGRSPVDLAADLGVTPAAVRKAKSRVLRKLKEEVGDLIA